jgi:hypothetical protein
MQPSMPRRLRLIALALAIVGAVVLMLLYIPQLARVEGTPVPPLDDTYIHLQYAKLLAKGYWFNYVPGEGYTTGATSPLYVGMLAVFFRIGLSDAAATWGAYLLGALALAGVAYGSALAAWRATADELASLVAPIVVFACGSLTSNSISGMETGVYAAALVLALAATFSEERPTWRLYVLYAIVPLLRPDGAIFVAIFAAATVWRTRGERGLVHASLKMAPVFVPFALYLLGNLLLTGEVSTAGMRLKSFSNDIYLDKPHAIENLLSSAWTRLPQVFASKLEPPLLPVWVAPVALLGVVLPGGPGGKRLPRLVLVASVVLGYMALNNTRANLHGWQRYFVPLYPLLAVGVAMAVSRIAALVPKIPARVRTLTPAVLGLVVAVPVAFSHGVWRKAFGAESTEIAHKQVAIALKIRDLPADAWIATMDVGAVAFIGGHRTFDVIGLTTNGIYPYALLEVPGRVESLGDLPAEARPGYAALYGMSLPKEAVARKIAEARGFILYDIDWNVFDTANHPAHAGPVADRVDVADYKSEKPHDYSWEPYYLPVLERAEWHAGTVGGAMAIDSARHVTHEAFTLRGRPGTDATLVVRVLGKPALTVTWNGKPVTLVPGANEGFVELEAQIPGADVLAENRVVADGPRHPSYHWFLLQPDAPPERQPGVQPGVQPATQPDSQP